MMNIKTIICYFKGHVKFKLPKVTTKDYYYKTKWKYKKLKKWGLKYDIFEVEVCQRCGKKVGETKIYSDLNRDAAQLKFNELHK